VVRPEDVRLLGPGDPGAAATGEVTDVQFKGDSSQVAVDVAGLDRPFLVSVPGATAVERGARVGLSWSHAVAVADVSA
jgi:spermidine/putrescine transport system ATP-binding protein/putrescine transport system ATP-binding protein